MKKFVLLSARIELSVGAVLLLVPQLDPDLARATASHNDQEFQAKVKNSLKIDVVGFTRYNSIVMDKERRLVTGQNQNSGHETAEKIRDILLEKSTGPVLN